MDDNSNRSQELFTGLSHLIFTKTLWDDISYGCCNRLPCVSDFKQHRFGGQNYKMSSMGLKSRDLHPWFPLEALRGECISLTFITSRSHQFPWHVVPSSIFTAHRLHLCFHQHLIFSASDSSCILLGRAGVSIWGLADNLGWSPHHEIYNLIPFAKLW